MNLFKFSLLNSHSSTLNFLIPKFFIITSLTICFNSFFVERDSQQVDRYTVKDLFSFVKEITSAGNHGFMASFDVSRLFTNIPLNESIDLCLDLLFENSDVIDYNDCSLDRKSFRKLLCSAVRENHLFSIGSSMIKLMVLPWVLQYGPHLPIFICVP